MLLEIKFHFQRKISNHNKNPFEYVLYFKANFQAKRSKLDVIKAKDELLPFMRFNARKG